MERTYGAGVGTIRGVMPLRDDGRIPSLDGLRAVSIGAVVLGHLAGTVNFPAFIGDAVRNTGLVDVANLGVRVFFVISGFLITGILLKESQRYGTISLRRFYLRRTMRIFPAYYVFVATIVALTAMGALAVKPGDVIHALTYTTNYDPDRAKVVGHLWSLAVEEQFYLLWPVTIVLLGLHKARWAALAVVLVAPVVRALEYHFVPQWQGLVGNTFETTADAIAMGCLLALTLDPLLRTKWFARILDAPWSIVAMLAFALVLGNWGVTRLLLSVSLVNLAIALGVAYCVVRSGSPVGRFLNVPSLVFIGTLSYSIYLWQQVFVDRESLSVTAWFPFNLVLVAICALASYYLVERPFLRWRPRVEQRLFGRRAPVVDGVRGGSHGDPDAPAQPPALA
jgi:peptidoglycan/LPS O-acetylase OafA/YrhL